MAHRGAFYLFLVCVLAITANNLQSFVSAQQFLSRNDAAVDSKRYLSEAALETPPELKVSEACKDWKEIAINADMGEAEQLWTDGSKILALTGSSIQQTIDNGATWEEVASAPGVFGKIVKFNVNKDRLLWATSGSTSVSMKTGADWVAATEETFVTLHDGAEIQDICSNGDFVMVAAAKKSTLAGEAMVWFTRDNGTQWWNLNGDKMGSRCGIDTTGTYIHVVSHAVLDFIPPDANVDKLPGILGIPAILTSKDGGINWETTMFYTKSDNINGLLVTPSAQYITTEAEGIFRSEKHWFATYRDGHDNNHLPVEIPAKLGSVVGSASTAFIDTPGTVGFGIVTTDDRGQTWKQLSPPEAAKPLDEVTTQGIYFDEAGKQLLSMWKIGGVWKLYSATCEVKE